MHHPTPASLDVTRLAEIADGDADVIAAVLELYFETAAEALATLATAARHGDHATLVATAHRLRGASASAGAARMASLAAALESGAGRGDVLSMSEIVLENLRAELACVRVAAGGTTSVATSHRHAVDVPVTQPPTSSSP